jgi:predicted dehydrogenase
MIGVGNRGSHLLRQAMQNPNARIVAVCDIKPDRLDKAASAAAKDNPKTYREWRQVLDNKDVGAVFIATPPHLHSEMAIAAIKAGKHIYCEKPVGVTPQQVRDLLRAAKGYNKIFTSGQQLRSHPQIAEAVKKIREGIIGEVIMIKAQRHAGDDLNHEGSSADWYFDVSKSGGYLIEQSVHNLDVCNWVAGAHPTRCAGFGSNMVFKNDPPGRTIFDCGSMVFEYPNGSEMTFTQNVFHPRGMPLGGQYVHVFGSKGAVDLLYACMMYPRGGGQPTVIAEKKQFSDYPHVEAFYNAILNGGTTPADITIGATAALTSILGHEAMTKQTVVKWSDLGVTL